MVDRRRERQPCSQVAMVCLAETVGGFDVVVSLTIQVASPDLQPQEVFLERATKEELGLARVALIAVLTRRVIVGDRTAPLRRDLARDDVDHPANRIRAVQR